MLILVFWINHSRFGLGKCWITYNTHVPVLIIGLPHYCNYAVLKRVQQQLVKYSICLLFLALGMVPNTFQESRKK